MKTFFGGTFIDKDKLKSNGINYPIKLEYYKIVDQIKENIEYYGVEVVKTEYIGEKVEIEEKKIEGIMKSEKNIEKILETLKKNEVTPIGCEDVLNDLLKQDIYK